MSEVAYIGIDAGGTKMEVLAQQGASLEAGFFPGVHARQGTVSQVANQLAIATRQVFAAMDSATDMRLCAGVAGAADTSLQEELQGSLADDLAVPASHIQIVSDANVAFQAAFPDYRRTAFHRILVIAGTGSGCYSFDSRNRFTRTGGWGSRLGDPGSGTALGTDAVRHLLESVELNRSTPLGTAILDQFTPLSDSKIRLQDVTVADVLSIVYGTDFSPSILAPILLNCLPESIDARTILAHQTAELSKQAGRLAKIMGASSPNVALAGGLSENLHFQKALTGAILSLMPAATVTKSVRKPVEGALEMAQQMD